MARPTKQGIEYFSLDVDFFTDIKVRKIARACGPNASSILICLLCNIYKNEGYYILWDEDLPFVIADTIGVTEGAVIEVMRKAVQVGFFDKAKFDEYKILTSSGIQKRFHAAVYKRKEITLDRKYVVNDVKNSVMDIQNLVNDIQSTQSKVKERKVKENKEIKKTKSSAASELRDLSETELNDCYRILSENTLWRETVVMNTRQAGYRDFDGNKFDAKLRDFFRKLANEGETEKAPRDAMAHFARWLKIELENGNKNRTGYPSKQEANDYALHRVADYWTDACRNSGGEFGDGR